MIFSFQNDFISLLSQKLPLRESLSYNWPKFLIPFTEFTEFRIGQNFKSLKPESKNINS